MDFATSLSARLLLSRSAPGSPLSPIHSILVGTRSTASLKSSPTLGTRWNASLPDEWRLRSCAAGVLALFFLATVWATHGAQTATPVRVPSQADQQLFQAVRQGNLPQLKAAVAAGANVNSLGTNGLPPLLELLHAASAPLDSDDRQCVACLLEHSAAVDPMDSDRRTPLIHAARLGDLETVRLLVEAGAHVMARDRFHKSALFYAVEANRRDIVLYLAANGDLLSLPVNPRKPH